MQVDENSQGPAKKSSDQALPALKHSQHALHLVKLWCVMMLAAFSASGSLLKLVVKAHVVIGPLLLHLSLTPQ